jgi:hypothetical protein
MPLIDAMFASGVVQMGPSRHDPSRQVATFDPAAIRTLAAARERELQRFVWLVGDWRFENEVPAGRLNPAYTDVGRATYVRSEDGAWICSSQPNGKLIPLLTFDAWSGQWIYILASGAYGVLRSPGWTGNSIVFTGTMTMVGVTCEWRMTWSKHSDDYFQFVNEELLLGGGWSSIDEWRHTRLTER